MIRKVTMYEGICDGCGRRLENNGGDIVAWSDKSNCGLSECDEEFKTKFKQLLNETKLRFQKEFDEI